MQKSLQGWFPTRDSFFLKPRAGCYSAQAQRTVKGACLWWPFLSAWLPICTLHLWPDLAFQTLQAKHPEKSEKSLLVWPVFKRMACSMRELVEPLLPTSRWRTHRPSFIIFLFLGKCVLQLGARRKYGQKSSRKPTILQLKGTNCTYLLALSARLLALAAFSLTPLNPVSRVFHQRTREQRFVVCFPLWLCRLFEFNCQAGRRSLFLCFPVVRQSNCSGMHYAWWTAVAWTNAQPHWHWAMFYKKNLSGGRTLPAQCITCGHEHQNQFKSNNHQSAPLPKTNHI